MDEARDIHFKELGDAKYYFQQKKIESDDIKKKHDVHIDLNNAYIKNVERKEQVKVEEKHEKERMNK